MYPEIVSIGPLTLYSFGAMMGLGFLAGAHLAGREFGRHGLDPEIASNVLLAAAIGGLAGSRIWAIFDGWSAFVAAPLSTLLSGAGFVWYGGLIGGTLAVSVVFWRQGIPWMRGADCCFPGLVVGQALGRIGCHLSGDGDWGSVTTVPWGVAYTDAIIGWPHAAGVLVHPTPLYESVAYTASFALMWAMRRRLPADGSMVALYLLTAPTARFFIEFYRINPPVFAGLTQAQLFSLALMASGAVLMATRWNRVPAATATPTVAAGG